MTTTPPPDGGPTSTGTGTQTQDGPHVTRDELRDLTRLRRTTGDQRTVAGVAGGLGRHLDVDPVILKVAFVVLTFFGGAGLLLYGAIWLLVPDDRSTTAPLGLDDRSRTVGLVVAGGIAALALAGSSLGDGFVPFPLVVLIAIALLVVLQVNRRKEGGITTAAPAPPGAPTPAPAPAYVGTAAPSWTPPPVRVEPRRRGPVLFWFTLALAALGLGILGTVDLAGAPVPGPAYPALVVALSGAMLVLGAFWGRAGGLILVGLVATVALVGSLAAQEIDGDDVRAAPTSAAELRPSYSLDAGELVLDLRGITDLAALDGRTVTLRVDAGQIEVLVPPGLDVGAAGTVDGVGQVRLFGAQQGGFDVDLTSPGNPTDPTTPHLRIEASVDLGEIEIHTVEGTPR